MQLASLAVDIAYERFLEMRVAQNGTGLQPGHSQPPSTRVQSEVVCHRAGRYGSMRGVVGPWIIRWRMEMGRLSDREDMRASL